MAVGSGNISPVTDELAPDLMVALSGVVRSPPLPLGRISADDLQRAAGGEAGEQPILDDWKAAAGARVV